MKITDITRILQSAPVYPGDEIPTVTEVSSLEDGEDCRLSVIKTGSHSGTHADAPTHYLGQSRISIEKMPLEKYYGKCLILAVPENTFIDAQFLKKRLNGATKLLLKTMGSSYLDKTGAKYLAQMGLETLGTDALSIAPPYNEKEIHEIILGAGIAVIENLLLDDVAPGEYLLSAFPIKIGGCDGAPVRAVLIEE